MGTTLTGTTPQDTYDSLIKVTDNGPLSGTAKYLSDGLGNDSVLAVSTSRIGIGSTIDSGELITAYGASEAAIVFQNTNSGTGSGQGLYLGTLNAENYLWTYENQPLIIATNNAERMRISSTGNVGIGTSAPAGNLHIASASDTGIRIQAGASSLSYIDLADTASGTPAGSIAYNHIVNAITFATGTNVERARIDSDGLKFNGDTLAANALDDYEEGTFTPTIIGSTTAGTATYGGGQAGTYTKIGNVVYFQIYLGYSGGTGTGNLRIAGLPFTIPNDLPSFTFGAFLNVALTALNIPIAGGIVSTNQITIEQIPTGGGSQTSVPYDGSGVIQISGFYRV